MYACNGILFNHESPVRGETFVTRKITRALTRIHLNLQEYLYLGNLDAKRDWGHARDYVRMQWLMLQQEAPDDFVIATGEQHSVKDFLTLSAKEFGIAIRWEGTGTDLTIKELAELIKEITDFKGEIVFDTSKPNGTPQKLLDISKLTNLGRQAKIDLKQGINSVYALFKKNVYR